MFKSLSTFDYKKWGHRHIDTLVGLGIPRNKVYSRLKKRLKFPSHGGHFGRTDEHEQLDKMVRVLESMIEQRQKELDPKVPKVPAPPSKNTLYKKEVFSDKEVLRKIGRRNSFKAAPWYKKLYLWLTRQV